LARRSPGTRIVQFSGPGLRAFETAFCPLRAA